MPIFSDKQRQRLDQFRREHAIESASLSPEERMRRADELRQMASSLRPGARSTSDESVEIVKGWKRRLRDQA